MLSVRGGLNLFFVSSTGVKNHGATHQSAPPSEDDLSRNRYLLGATINHGQFKIVHKTKWTEDIKPISLAAQTYVIFLNGPDPRLA